MARKTSKANKKKVTKDDIKDSVETKETQTESTTDNKEEAEINDTEEPSKNKASKKDKKSELIEWQEKAAELNDKFLRLYSEFDNYRKRTAREKIEMSKTASEDVISELLPVLDDFQRAIKSTEESTDCEAVKEGMSLIYNKFTGISG